MFLAYEDHFWGFQRPFRPFLAILVKPFQKKAISEKMQKTQFETHMKKEIAKTFCMVNVH